MYVIGDDTNTGVGLTDIVSDMSALPVVWTITDVIVELFEATGSVVADVTSAEFKIVVPAAGAAGVGPGLICTTKEKPVAVAPLVNADPSVHTTCPVAPAAGAVHVHPAGAAIDTNVVFGGVCWYKTAVVAEFGPLLVTDSV